MASRLQNWFANTMQGNAAATAAAAAAAAAAQMEDDAMDVFDEDEAQLAMMHSAGRGGPTQQQTVEMYTKKLLHKDFYNDFEDDCDEEQLE